MLPDVVGFWDLFTKTFEIIGEFIGIGLWGIAITAGTFMFMGMLKMK